MASEIRVDKINSLSGIGTVSLSPTGVDISGITTAATLRATTGIVTSLTAGSLTSLGAVSGTTGTFSSDVSVAGDFQVPDVIKHEGDVDTRIRFPAADTFTVETGGSERFRVDSTGNTLIYGAIRKDNVSSSLTISGGNAADSSANIVLNGSSGSPANVTQFRTGSTERLRITSDGDMGLGTGGNTVTQRLDVRESNTAIFNPVSNLPTIARLYNTAAVNGTSAGLQLRTDNNNGSAGIQYIHAVNSSTNYDSDLVFSRRLATSGSYAESCRITNAGNIKFPSGQGIDFSATGQAASPSSEILDDYEEGTWTFVITPGGGSYQYNYGQTGYYRKIGNTVFINAWIHLTVASAVSGGITLSGLPFPCQNRSRNWIPVGGYNHGGPPQSSSGLWLVLTQNASTGEFTYNDDQFGSTSTLTAGNLPAAAELYINGSYFTDS